MHEELQAAAELLAEGNYAWVLRLGDRVISNPVLQILAEHGPMKNAVWKLKNAADAPDAIRAALAKL